MGVNRKLEVASRRRGRRLSGRRTDGGRLHLTRLGHSLRKAYYHRSKSNKMKYDENNKAKQILQRLKKNGHDVPFSIYDKFNPTTLTFVKEYQKGVNGPLGDDVTSPVGVERRMQARGSLLPQESFQTARSRNSWRRDSTDPRRESVMSLITSPSASIESQMDFGIPQEIWEQLCQTDDKVCAVLKGKLREHLDRLYGIIVIDQRPLDAVSKDNISREIKQGFKKLTMFEKNFARLARKTKPSKFLLPREFEHNAKAIFAYRLVFEMFGWSLPVTKIGGSRRNVRRHSQMIFTR